MNMLEFDEENKPWSVVMFFSSRHRERLADQICRVSTYTGQDVLDKQRQFGLLIADEIADLRAGEWQDRANRQKREEEYRVPHRKYAKIAPSEHVRREKLPWMKPEVSFDELVAPTNRPFVPRQPFSFKRILKDLWKELSN